MTKKQPPEIIRTTPDTHDTWRAIVALGREGAARSCCVSLDVVDAIIADKCARSTVDSRVKEHIRAVELARLDAMQSMQFAAAVDGDAEAVMTTLAIMKQRQTYVHGLRVADKQEITGENGGPIQQQVQTIDVDGARQLVDGLLLVLRGKKSSE